MYFLHCGDYPLNDNSPIQGIIPARRAYSYLLAMTLPVPDLRDLDCGSLNWARFMVVGYCQIVVAIHGNLNTSRLCYLCFVELCFCHRSESCYNRQPVYEALVLHRASNSIGPVLRAQDKS